MFLSGFSLLEVSISLLVIGIISNIFMTQFIATKKLYASQKTATNMDFVLKALGTYYISKEGELPYPSTSTNNVGMQSQSMQNTFGIVPFKTLGIMENFAKSGNGKWLLYRLNPFFRKNGASQQQKKLGIDDFESDIIDDKVAIILKSQSNEGKDEIVIWYSEKTFIANFAGNKVFTKKQQQVGLPVSHF
jgi:prepilin-type N-terminal cleavage/methylation domain-containing protein